MPAGALHEGWVLRQGYQPLFSGAPRLMGSIPCLKATPEGMRRVNPMDNELARVRRVLTK